MPDVLSLPALYSRVQQFHATQMHALDERRFDFYAATFTEDGEFRHTPGRPAARTRAGIAAELRAFHEERFGADPVQRRHWFGMLRLDPHPDGEIHAYYYVLVVTTRPGVREPETAPSCVVHDVLVEEHGELLVRSRWIEHDWQPDDPRPGTGSPDRDVAVSRPGSR